MLCFNCTRRVEPSHSIFCGWCGAQVRSQQTGEPLHDFEAWGPTVTGPPVTPSAAQSHLRTVPSPLSMDED